MSQALDPKIAAQLLLQLKMAKTQIIQLAKLNHIAMDETKLDPHMPAHTSCAQNLLHCVNFSIFRLDARTRGPVKNEHNIAGQSADIGQASSLNMARIFAEKIGPDLREAIKEMRLLAEASLALANANHAMTLDEALADVGKGRNGHAH